MAYGIKIISVVTEDGRPKKSEYFLKNLSEHTGEHNITPLLFESVEEAEVYAQNHELHSFEIDEWLK